LRLIYRCQPVCTLACMRIGAGCDTRATTRKAVLLRAAGAREAQIFEKYSKNIQKIFKKLDKYAVKRPVHEPTRVQLVTSCSHLVLHTVAAHTSHATARYSKNIQKIFKKYSKIFDIFHEESPSSGQPRLGVLLQPRTGC